MKKNILLFGAMWLSAILLLAPRMPDTKQSQTHRYNIALLIMATGEYVKFVPRLIESAEKYFCKNHTVTYYVFTQGELPTSDRIIKVEQEQMGWPYDTMMRFHVYEKNKQLYADKDYIFAVDADMLFVDSVGDEILSDRVATLHPNYIFEPKPYETNPLSTACINRGEGSYYFAGAFYGGKPEQFFALINAAKTNINIDLARGIIAAVNDESHLNRCLINQAPTLILSPSYCHFESWDSPYKKRLVAFDKPDHDKTAKRKMRTFNALDYYKKFLHEELRVSYAAT